MQRAPYFLALLAIALGLFMAGCGGGTQNVSATDVAVVDGTEIARSELDELFGLAKATYGSSFPKAGTPEYQSLQQQLVAFLVQREELEHEAEKLGVKISDKAVAKEREDLVATRFNGNEKALAAALKEQGLTDAVLLKTLRVSVLSKAIFDSVTKDVKVDDTEALTYYTQNQEQYKTTSPSRDVRHILIGDQVDPSCVPSPPTKTCAIDFDKSKAEADRIYAELKGGANFAALAKKFSDDPGSKDDGGKYQAIKGQSVPEFDKVAFELKTNQISEPVRTQFGYHVIQALTDARPAGVTPFESVKAAIKLQLLQTKRNETMTTWLEDLQKQYEGKVDYAAGLAPPQIPDQPTETQ
jgi:parvulin-like peptidyl-prolyl isomerase